MEKTLEQLAAEAQRIRLESDEKSRLRSNILAFMETHPVSAETLARHLSQMAPNPPFSLHRIAAVLRGAFMKPMPVMLILALILAGGTSFAAGEALPGEFLYPVKVNVNEEVRGWLEFSPEARASWEAERAEQRLEEAERLAAQNRLDRDARAEVETRFAAHAERVRERTEELKTRGDARAATEVHSGFEASLRAHARILEKLAEEKDEKDELAIAPLATSVRSAAETETRSRGELEARVHGEQGPGARRAAEGALKAAENKIAESRKLFERHEASFGAEIAAEGRARLEYAEKTAAGGRANLSAGEFSRAFLAFKKSQRVAQEAGMIIRARKELDIDLRFSSDSQEAEDAEVGELESSAPPETEPSPSPSETPEPSPSPSRGKENGKGTTEPREKDAEIRAETGLESELLVDGESLDETVSSLREIEKELGL